jgi:hypothetical protein
MPTFAGSASTYWTASCELGAPTSTCVAESAGFWAVWLLTGELRGRAVVEEQRRGWVALAERHR